MKRYLLFAGEEYYLSGGWNDFRGAFDTVEEAKRAVFEPRGCENGFWSQIVDTVTMKEVEDDHYVSSSLGLQRDPP